MTATKRITRIGAIFLLVIFLVSSMATMALAAQKSGCCTTPTSSKTYSIYKSFGTAIKLTATQKGRVMQAYTSTGSGTANYTIGWYYGRYKITITYPNGTTKSLTWDGESNTTKTLVGALQAKGTYTITISAVREPTKLQHVWSHHGYYWRTYPLFTIKY